MSQLVQDVAGLYVPSHDHLELEYVGSGQNGEGELKKVTYRKGGESGAKVAELSLSYNSDNKLEKVTKT